MFDNNKKSHLEHTKDDKSKDFGQTLSRFNESYVPTRSNSSATCLQSNCSLGSMEDDGASGKLDDTIQVTKQSSVLRSNSWTGRSQHMQSTVVSQHCVVCGEVANGHFFGAVVCLPCKSFFIRCTKNGEAVIQQQCYGNCDIKKQFRNRCQFCRYQQCLTMGMSRREKPETVQPQEGQELCKVCGDLANGIHFGVYTCEGCKKFFRRGLKEHGSYVCKGKDNCVLNPRNRNNCRACRYHKCVKVGMSREAIKMGRPRKVYQNNCSNDTMFSMETSARRSDGDFKNDSEGGSASYHDDSKEIVIKLEFDQELSAGERRCLRKHDTCFHDCPHQNGLRNVDDVRGYTSNYNDTGAKTSELEQRNTNYRPRELKRSCSSQDNCRDGTSKTESLHSQDANASLFHSSSLSQLYLENASQEISAHRSYLPFRSALQKLGNDSFELSVRGKHQKYCMDTYLCETNPIPAPETRLHSHNCSTDSKKLLVNGSHFDITNIDDKISDRLNGAVDLSDFSDSVSSHVLSHYSVGDYPFHFSEPRLPHIQLMSNSCVSERKTDLTVKKKKHDDWTETFRSTNPREAHLLPSRIPPDDQQDINHKSRGKHILDRHDVIDSVPHEKSAEYDGLILDLSLNAKTHLGNGNDDIKTSNFNNTNIVAEKSYFDHHNDRILTKQKPETQFLEISNHYVAHKTTKERVCGKHYTDSNTFIQSVNKLRKYFPLATINSSNNEDYNISSNILKTDCPVSNPPLYETVNNFYETDMNPDCGASPPPEIKTEISVSSQKQLFTSTAIDDHETRRHLVKRKLEYSNAHRDINCHLYSSTFLQPNAFPSSDLSPAAKFDPNAEVYNNNNNNNSNRLAFKLMDSTLSSPFSLIEMSTNKNIPAAVSPSSKEYPMEQIARSLPWITHAGNERPPEVHVAVKSQQKQLEELGSSTSEQEILYINEMFMVADTFTDTLYSSTQRKGGERVSSELAAVDGMFTEAYGYSPIKVTNFWKILYLSISEESSDKWRFLLTSAQLGWLSDVTQSYLEQVKACENDANRPEEVHNPHPLPGEGMNFWGQFLDMLTRQTHAEVQFLRKLPGIERIHPKDSVKLCNSSRLFGNTILMASREWFDPVRKRFKFFWNWKLTQNHPLYLFQNRMIRIGSLICNLHLDRTEVAILSALNVVSSEDDTIQNLKEISGHMEIFIKLLDYHLYSINVDPQDRIPELLSVMPKVRLMSMWYFNLIKNMRVNTCIMGQTLQDLTTIKTVMSTEDMLAR